MAIGIVSDDELNNEIDSLTKTVKIVEKPHKGRASDGTSVNVPDSLRKIIGETSVIEGRQEALGLAELFNISPSSVSAYANGSTSTKSYQEPSKSILTHINRSRERAIKKAHKTLNTALDEITPNKLEDVKARELAGIAKDMSAIIKNLEPEVPTVDEGAKGPQFVIFAPQFVKEERFDTITVDE